MVKKYTKNHLLCNDMIIKSMMKRRQLAYSAIAKICNKQQVIKVVK